MLDPLFVLIVGGMMAAFLVFGYVVMPLGICPGAMQNAKTIFADPIVELCNYISGKQ